MINYKLVKPLRMWCYKILPLVYDESLSYYETLCKMSKKLNEIIEDVNQIPLYIDEVIDERLTDEHIKEIIDKLIDDYKHTITPNDDGKNIIASRNWSMGDWLWLDDILYIVTKDITEGNGYVFTGENANVKVMSVEEQNEVIYYPNDKKLSIHGKISDYSEIVSTGDYHIYHPRVEAIEIRKVD